ncbi:MAG: hypothetical protein Q9183_004636 [Haloplaca sp. 2 TL-2023]
MEHFRDPILPSIAPKPAINIKHIRENPDLYKKTCIDRNYQSQKDHPQKILQLFNDWKELQRNALDLRKAKNRVHSRILQGQALRPSNGPDLSRQNESLSEDYRSLVAEAKRVKDECSKVEFQEAPLLDEIEHLATGLPNLTSDETPVGVEPEIVGFINKELKPPIPRAIRDHISIGTDCGLLDFAGAATTSGWGWYYLKNEGALLEQALVQYALHVAMTHGFSVVTPPSMVYSHIAAACGYQPRDQGGEQQSYIIAQQSSGEASNANKEGKPELTLAGTAEIPFAGMKANTMMDRNELPLQIVGPSRCYRAEAGARGLDTKGLYRVHEFTKVEMFAWTLKGNEHVAFKAMLGVQKHILNSLGLRCRILEMPSTDLGASAVRKVDIEAFFPSRQSKNDGWGEVTSTSICTDYQTRRLNTRVKPAPRRVPVPDWAPDGKKSSVEDKTEFPSTVNGTALAVPRVLAAIIENGWSEEHQCIRIPHVLHHWMHGIQHIGKPHR